VTASRPASPSWARSLTGAILALVVLGRAASAEAPHGVSVAVDPPREHGWWIGDELTHRAHIVMPTNWTLDTASIPRPRAVFYWLDLAAVEIEQAAGRATVVTRWRTFYSPLEPSRREVPSIPLRLRGPDGGFAVAIPGWSFITSPLRPILAPTVRNELRPDAAFAGIDARPATRAAGAWTMLALTALVALAWTQGWPPFHARRGLPLAAAARAVRCATDVRGAALALHRGLDATHGRALLGRDLDLFLVRHPEFADQRGRLAAFFDISAALFFDQRDPPADAAPIIRRLAGQLAAVERGRR
jgi:mxaA protein